MRSWRTGSLNRPQCFAVTMSGCVLNKICSSHVASQSVCLFPIDYTMKSVYLCDVLPKYLARDTVNSKYPTMHWFSCIVMATCMLLHFQSFLGHLNRTQSVLTSLVTSVLQSQNVCCEKGLSAATNRELTTIHHQKLPLLLCRWKTFLCALHVWSKQPKEDLM